MRLKVLRARTAEQLEVALKQTLAEAGPWFVHARTEPAPSPGTTLLIGTIVHGVRFPNCFEPVWPMRVLLLVTPGTSR
ncbi:MAG: hypothetical protein M3P18_24090 [Actinomycetota bacterium]|nr:hypothetical protein [Actinomycetota bacterium]